MARCLKAEEKMRSKCAGAKHQHGNPSSPKNKISVCPEDLGPIHPMAGHTWTECYSNAACHKDAKKSVATTKVHKKKENVQEANVSNIALANEHVINNDNSFISDKLIHFSMENEVIGPPISHCVVYTSKRTLSCILGQ
jgi:hypothetical protein